MPIDILHQDDPFELEDPFSRGSMLGKTMPWLAQAAAETRCTVGAVNKRGVDLKFDENGVSNIITGERLEGIPVDFAEPDEYVGVTVVGNRPGASLKPFWDCYDAQRDAAVGQ